ncbi:flagellar assembly protein FliO [Noviherbaspirillum denitrificans]|uniref:Flagellar protein n=2 Tax=Noviherbaspirillum denitrificans TaxID=1968433 RepID=A0A254T828_9BURK|nr:flagellar biosynthetic protein FliO [Noviherbaspirillum denitrificans]OWW18804.1 flagellar assembly protein FliO [Noviherbaspirillum denitrificans]
MRQAFLPFMTLLTAVPALAAEQAATAAPATSTGSMLQVVLGLAVVLALMAGAAWVLKRMGMAGAGGSSVAKVVGGVSVGNRERVMVVEVADQWIVVGVAPGRVTALSTMPRQEIQAASVGGDDTKNFAAWLKQTIDKRNGN